MFHLEALAERLPLRSIFQNMTFIHYVQRLANVTKIAKFNLPSIYLYSALFELVPTFSLSRSGWLTYPSHIMPVQAFSIFIFSCHPERNIDVRIDQLLYQKYDQEKTYM